MLPHIHHYFKFLDWHLDSSTYQLSLNYEVETIGKVTEVLSLPDFVLPQDKDIRAQVYKACDLVHKMSGVSYYKVGLAKSIVFEHNPPSRHLQQFFEITWQHGLAELAYVNDVTLDYFANQNQSLQANFIVATQSVSDRKSANPIRSLVAIGGGKDSLVTIEELKCVGHDITLFMVGGSVLIQQLANFTQLPLLKIGRKIDEKLIEYNQTGMGFNGHVPITAINSSIAVLTALLFGFEDIVFSNERSANSANTLNKQGDSVNHQYSKSAQFEQHMCAFIGTEISPKLHYYSQQRAFSELAILQKFSHYPAYFPVFSSCNRNFHLKGSCNHKSLWCCDCPKCRFVFLGLAAFVEKKQLLAIFKHNMLDDMSQLAGFEQLLGLKGFKPFECVGEIAESQLALNLIKHQPQWQNDLLVKVLANQIPETTDEQYQHIMQASTR